MRAREVRLAVDAERVVPDDPATAGESDFALHAYFEFGGIFIADREPERTVVLQNTSNFTKPVISPAKIVVRLALS